MDLGSLFQVLRNPSDNTATYLDLAAEGDAIASRQKHAVLTAKRADGTLRAPKVTDNDELIVSTDNDSQAALKASGLLAGTTTETLVAEITLQNSKVYRDLEWIVSCFRDAIFRIVWIDDEGVGDVETELGQLLCSPGDVNDSGRLESEFTSGASGVQKLKILGKNLNSLSDLRATINAVEEQ